MELLIILILVITSIDWKIVKKNNIGSHIAEKYMRTPKVMSLLNFHRKDHRCKEYNNTVRDNKFSATKRYFLPIGGISIC